MSKYKNVRYHDPTHGTFDSLGEYYRFCELRMLQSAGKISCLKRQVTFELIPACTLPDGKKQRAVNYVADFRYFDNEKGEWVTEDYKGTRTDVYKLKKKLMYWRWGILIKETGRSG